MRLQPAELSCPEQLNSSGNESPRQLPAVLVADTIY